jgi:chemotaxis protein methyltransferase CheR
MNDLQFASKHLDESQFLRLKKFIESELGIKMPSSKRIMLESRLQRRVRAKGFESFAEYLDYAFDPENIGGELIHMVDLITTNKTDFFRESDHFDFLYASLLPRLSKDIQNRPLKKLTVWSAGCSSGEEPYTIAMVLEAFREINPGFDYSILGTDLSSRMLAAAETAVYPIDRISMLSLEEKRRYFLKSKTPGTDLVRVKPNLRAKLSFKHLNLMDDAFDMTGEFDIIFCRNVLIYFDRGVQRRVIMKLSSKLRDSGYLFLGHSETITGFNLPLIGVIPTVFQKRR